MVLILLEVRYPRLKAWGLYLASTAIHFPRAESALASTTDTSVPLRGFPFPERRGALGQLTSAPFLRTMAEPLAPKKRCSFQRKTVTSPYSARNDAFLALCIPSETPFSRLAFGSSDGEEASSSAHLAERKYSSIDSCLKRTLFS
jgi:hypothetical protein